MMEESTSEIIFLKGGGEAGEITRNYNWASTSLGEPENWPQPLRIALGIVLHSRFPMFIFWGPEQICFYNDAYRPSLGEEGKHPAIGRPGEIVWPEIWDYLKPKLDQVLAGGESIWEEDHLLPIYRNGKLDVVYWTYSYSPIMDDEGNIGGVMVICTETTEKVTANKNLSTSVQHFRDLVKNAPVAIAVFKGFDLVVEMANKAYMMLVGQKMEDFVGKPLFESLPEAREILEPLANEVLRTGKPLHVREFEIVINRNGKDETCYFNAAYEAIYEEDGSISGIMVVANEVTDLVVAKKEIEFSEQRFRNLLNQAPDAILILKGEDLVLEVANKPLLDLWQVDETAIGKPFLEILPEMENQVLEMLQDVYHNGVTHYGYEMPIIFERKNGEKDTIYFNFVYHPYREKDETITGVLVMASNVTGQVASQKMLEENQSDLNLAIEIGELGTFRIDLINDTATYSERIMDWFGLTENSVNLDTFFN
ncbi:MAG: PAS domain S-box protein, partial [Sphingobacteriales bacterium]